MNFREKRPKRPFRTIFLMKIREKEAESAKRKPKEPPAETPVHDEEDTDRDEPEVPASCIPGIGLDLEPEYSVSG